MSDESTDFSFHVFYYIYFVPFLFFIFLVIVPVYVVFEPYLVPLFLSKLKSTVFDFKILRFKWVLSSYELNPWKIKWFSFHIFY